MKHRIDSWVCWGGLLTYTKTTELDGKATSEPAEIRVAESSVIAAQAAESEPSNWDTYREFSDICPGWATEYYFWIKGNAAYGDSNGAIGTFDVILKVHLNDRTPRYNTLWYHDSGPALTMDNMFVYCKEDNGIWPDNNCGTFGADNQDGDFSVCIGSYISPNIWGNNLVNSNDYYTQVAGYFWPSGYPRFTMGTLTGQHYECYGTANCQYLGN